MRCQENHNAQMGEGDTEVTSLNIYIAIAIIGKYVWHSPIDNVYFWTEIVCGYIIIPHLPLTVLWNV